MHTAGRAGGKEGGGKEEGGREEREGGRDGLREEREMGLLEKEIVQQHPL